MRHLLAGASRSMLAVVTVGGLGAEAGADERRVDLRVRKRSRREE